MTIEHLFNTGRKLAEASGFRSTSLFFPSEKDVKEDLAKPKTPPPSPAMLKVQASRQSKPNFAV